MKDELDKYKECVDKIKPEEVDKIVDVLFSAWKGENAVYLIGNGGSAEIATHWASDLSKSTIVENKKRLKALSLANNTSLLTAWSNDSNFDEIFSEQVENFVERGDILMAISVHGGGERSSNLVKAIERASKKNAITVGLVGFDGGIIKKIANYSIHVPINSTPFVESVHSFITHLVTSKLRERIENEKSGISR